MKKYLTPINIAFAVLALGLIITVVVIFFPSHKNDEKLQLLQQQQKDLKQITQQLQHNDDENRKRDSLLFEAFLQNTASREVQLSNTKTSANEKIDHINSPSFNNDSIRRAFANK
jgi:hypothetical protein